MPRNKMFNSNQIKLHFVSACNSALELVGIDTPIMEILRNKLTWVIMLLTLLSICTSQSFLALWSLRSGIADNILRNTGIENMLNPLHQLTGWIYWTITIYIIFKLIKYYIYELMYPVRVIKQLITPNPQSNGILRRCLSQLKEYPTAFVALIYQLQKVDNRVDLVSNLTILSSLLKLPQGIWEKILGSLPQTQVVEGQEEMLDDLTSMVALGLTLTKTEIGDVKLDNFIVNVDRNQRACENILKRMNPLLVKLGLASDGNYETILEIASEINSLVSEESWLKIILRTCPNDLLNTTNVLRVETLRKKVELLRTKLNTLTSKELRSDKVVVECHKILASFETLFVEVSVLEQSNRVRVKPVGVSIQGEKQIGKTNFVSLLTRLVCAYVKEHGGLSFRDANKWNTWFMQSRDEFDTGYSGQKITYADDAFQQKDNKDHLLWYNFISNSPVGTNQADLKQKGLLYQSKLVFTTCNQLPVRSITVQDIEALHARFPHTICMRRNDKPMPRGSKKLDSYEWVDMYYGPMSTAVAESGTVNLQGSGMIKLSVAEIVKKIGDDLILQDKFYNSSLLPEEGVQLVNGQEESEYLAEWYRARPNVFDRGLDPMAMRMNAILTSFNHAQLTAADQELLEYTRINISSFRAWNVIKTMMSQGTTFEEWWTYYVQHMTRGYSDNLLTLPEIEVTPFNGLQLLAARRLRDEQVLFTVNATTEHQETYRNIHDELKDYLDREILLLDTDVVNIAMAKLVLSEVNREIKQSTWADVYPWVRGLKNRTTNLTFVEHMDVYPTKLSDFIITLSDWEVTNAEIFESYFAQPLLIVRVAGKLHLWSPMIDRGCRLVEVTPEFMEIRSSVINTITMTNGPVVNGTRLLASFAVGYPQNGLPINVEAHQKWITLVAQSTQRVHTLIDDERIRYLYRRVNIREFQITVEEQAYMRSLKDGPMFISNIRNWVKEDISQKVSSKYTLLSEYYKRLTQNGIGSLLAVLRRLGVPVSDYWNNLLTDNAPVITAALVATITTLLIVTLIKVFKYGVQGEEQSKGEKRAKHKKLVTSKLQKVKFANGKEQANGDHIQLISKSDLGLKTECDFAVIEQLFDHIEEHTDLNIVGMCCSPSNDKINHSALYGALESEYDFSYDTPELPTWKKVVTYREDGKRVIEFSIRGITTEEKCLEEIEHLLEVARYYPYASWTFDGYLKRENDQVLYFIELSLLTAKTKAGIVDWTRADVKNITTVHNMLNGSEPINIQNIVLGVQESAPAAYDTSTSVIRNNLLKLNCVKPEDVHNVAVKGVTVYGLGSGNVILLPAHAVRENKWIRFRRSEGSECIGIAIVEPNKIDYVRDIAIAKILTRFEAEQHLCDKQISQDLTCISKQNFVFPDITKHLLTAEQMENEMMDCTTLHYFGSSRTFAMGKTTEFVIRQYEISPSTYLSKKLMACAQGLQSQLALSQRGDCGSPVVLASGKRAGKLMGFHAYLSPSNRCWYSTVITVEDLGYISGNEHSFKDPWQDLLVQGLPTDLPKGPELEYVANLVKPSLPVTSSSLDHWHKSPFADQFEEQLAPGRLDPYDPYITSELPTNLEGRKSLILGPNSEMGKTLPELNLDLLKWCTDQLIIECVAVMKSADVLKQVSSDTDEMLDYALNGDIDNEYVKGMEINKAAGLPWSLMGAPKKSDFIELDDETGIRSFKNDKLGNALRDRVKLKIQQARLGKRIISLSSSKLKDQPIKIAQARSGRTRVFHCIPVDLILFQAALYGPFKEAYTKLGLKLNHAVGIDPKSAGWAEIAAYMTKHPNYFDADYKNYDKYLHRSVYKQVRRYMREVIQKVKPDDWDQARAVEEEDAIDTFVVDYRTVYKTNRGNKSGSYTTTIDNNIANRIYAFYAWCVSTKVKSLAEYNRHVSEVNFGDDKILSVSDEYADKFNYLTYRDVLNALGHVITPGSKDGEEKPFTTLDNLLFLKRGFKIQDGMVLAPLLQRSIEGPFVWTDINEDQITVWVNLVQEQMIEAALWGEEYYNSFCAKLKCGTNRHLNEALAVLLSDSWEYTFQKFCKRYYGS
ncbi:MAG: RNA helicase [Guiyang argiope bruennichi nora-like virus 1]|nr:MAG: RNA helicase [Guiyang argiope bruennichi nora-like virus 1]